MDIIVIVTLAGLGYLAYLFYLRHKMFFDLLFYVARDKMKTENKKNFVIEDSVAIVTYNRRGKEEKLYLPYLSIPSMMKTKNVRLLVDRDDNGKCSSLNGKTVRIEKDVVTLEEGGNTYSFYDMTQQKGIPYMIKVRYLNSSTAVSVVLEECSDGYLCSVLNAYGPEDIPMYKEYSRE